MGLDPEIPWTRLAPLSHIGFTIAGVGFLLALGLLVVDTLSGVTVSELVISLAIVPSLFALTVLGLPGFYPYVADASPRLALAGALTGFVAGGVMLFMTVAKVTLHVLGIIGFTEDGPLVGLLFVILAAFFLSVLFYGLASVRSGAPSRLVGVALLILIVEPGVALLNDVLGLDFGIAVLYGALGVAGAALLLIGYSLRRAVTTGAGIETPGEMPG